jgi:cytochrome c556
MLKVLVAAVSIIGFGLAATTPAAAQDAEHAVKARQGIYQNYLWHFGPLVAMARGDIEYDAERATRHAQLLDELVPFLLPEFFVEGSSNAERDDTRALPVIWEDFDGFMESYEAMVVEVSELAAVAGNGQAELAAQVRSTGESCGACHDDYRAE